MKFVDSLDSLTRVFETYINWHFTLWSQADYRNEWKLWPNES